jgi:hypothetical protein
VLPSLNQLKSSLGLVAKNAGRFAAADQRPFSALRENPRDAYSGSGHSCGPPCRVGELRPVVVLREFWRQRAGAVGVALARLNHSSAHFSSGTPLCVVTAFFASKKYDLGNSPRHAWSTE